jgi:hypothetical protein
MKARIICISISFFFGSVAVYHFFRALDSGLEVSSLKTTIQYHKRELLFLQNVANSALMGQKITITSFQRAIGTNGVVWDGDSALIGSYKVKRNGDYIVHIELVGF